MEWEIVCIKEEQQQDVGKNFPPLQEGIAISEDQKELKQHSAWFSNPEFLSEEKDCSKEKLL